MTETVAPIPDASPRPDRWYALPARLPGGWGHAGCFLLVGLLAVGVRLVFIEDPLLSDDMNYYHHAAAVAGGDWTTITRQSYIPKRLGIVLPTALLIRLFGRSEISYYLLPLLFAFFEAGLAYLIASRLANRLIGLAAAGAVALLPLSVLNDSLLLPDLMNSACMAAAFWALLRAADAKDDRHHAHWLWGVAIGAILFFGYMTRVTVLFMAPVVGIVGLWARRWRTVVASAAVVLAGIGLECAAYAMATPNHDWLHRLHCYSSGYVHGYWGTQKLKAASITEMTTRFVEQLRFSRPDLLWFFASLGAGIALPLIPGDRRRRWLAVWFWMILLILHYAVIGVNPVRPLLEARVKFLVLAVVPGCLVGLLLLWQIVRLLRHLLRWLPAAAFIAIVLAGYLYCLKDAVRERELRYFGGGYGTDLVALVTEKVERHEARRIAASAAVFDVMDIFGFDADIERRMHHIVGDPRDARPGTLVILDREKLGRWDERAGTPRNAAQKRADLTTQPPDHWQFVGAARLRDREKLYLYLVHEPREGFTCMSPVSWWPRWQRNRKTPPPTGYRGHPGGRGYAGHARWSTDAEGGLDAVRLTVTGGKYFFCYNGDQPDYENPPDEPQELTERAWYLLRFRARTDARKKVLNAFLYTYPRHEYGRFDFRRFADPWPRHDRRDLRRADGWTWCMLAFRARPDMRKIRWALTPYRTGSSIVLSDVQLYECHPPRRVQPAPTSQPGSGD